MIRRFSAFRIWTLVVAAMSLAWPGLAGASVDASALPLFWRIHDSLAAGRQPSDAQWTELFQTPGYRVLEQRERRSAALRRGFLLAYDPARAEERASFLRDNPNAWLNHVLPHLMRIPENRARLQRFERQLQSEAFFRRALARAAPFLPPGTIGRLSPPEVSLIYFIDGRGYDRILLDPLHVMNHPDPDGLMGHELHHNYRNRIARHRPYGSDLVAWAIVNVEVEGIASMVDKARVPGMSDAAINAAYRDPESREYFRMYAREYRRSSHWLREFDALLQQIGAAGADRGALAQRLHELMPDNGRMVGHYMGDVIRRVSGRRALAASVGNPTLFWQSYNRAADRARAYRLSDRAMAVIEEIGRRYDATD